MNARHLSKTANWGSTDDQIGLGHALMGGVDLDVASSAFWNRRVRARRFYTKRDDALTKRWRAKRVWLNPPGDPSGMLVKAFWLKLVEHWLDGDIGEACYVGFSLEQLVSLQGIYDTDRNIPQIPNPLDFPTVVPMRRSAYVEQKGARAVESEAPGHGGFFTWLPPRDLVPRLVEESMEFNARGIGAIHLPHHRLRAEAYARLAA